MAKELIVTKNITTLIQTIRDEIEQGRIKVENIIETEKTKTYWNIGKHIYKHILDNGDRADYGDYVIKTLADSLHIGRITLYRTIQFYETYPRIVQAPAQLTWTHYKLLVMVKDEDKRKEYEQRVINENLTTRELEELIKKDKETGNENKPPVLKEMRGIPHTYRLKNKDDNDMTLYIDLGFRFYTDKLRGNNNYTEETIIQTKKNKNSYTITEPKDITMHQIYTYRGTVKEIIDGDTLWVNLDLGFDTWTRQKVRFRGINTPKIETEAGIKAKKYIERQLKPCEYIIVKTYYRDKFNRYLADIFYDKNETDILAIAEKGAFLNQQLLDKGLADKY